MRCTEQPLLLPTWMRWPWVRDGRGRPLGSSASSWYAMMASAYSRLFCLEERKKEYAFPYAEGGQLGTKPRGAPAYSRLCCEEEKPQAQAVGGS